MYLDVSIYRFDQIHRFCLTYLGVFMIRPTSKHPVVLMLLVLCHIGVVLIMAPMIPSLGDRFLLSLVLLGMLTVRMSKCAWEIVLIHAGREFRVGDPVYSTHGAPPFSGQVVGFELNQQDSCLVVETDGKRFTIEPQYVRTVVY